MTKDKLIAHSGKAFEFSHGLTVVPLEYALSLIDPEPKLPILRPLNCDQVAWMLAAITRYLPKQEAPQVCRLKEMNGYALLYEIMEVAGLRFEDERAARNGTPPDVSRMQFKTDNPNKCGSNRP